MTTYSKEDIEKALAKATSFSVASLQRDFGVSYERAKYLVNEFVRSKKAEPLGDGLSYSYETALKKAQRESKPASTPFSRFFNKSPMDDKKLFDTEVAILSALYKKCALDIEQGEEPHSYVIEVRSAGGPTIHLYMDLYQNRFRIHDNRFITDTFVDDLSLNTIEGQNLLSRMMKDFSGLSTSADGCISHENIDADSAPEALDNLYRLMILVGEVEAGMDEMLVKSNEKLYKALNDALAYLIIEVNSRSIEDAKGYIRGMLDGEDLEDTDEVAFKILLNHLEGMTDYNYTSTASVLLTPRIRRYKFIPKE